MHDAQQATKADTRVRGRERELTIIGNAGEYVFERIRATGAFYESDVLETLAHLPIRADRVVVDVGANIGNHSVYFAEFLDRPVVAVEPQGDNADLLEANLGINNLRGRARVVRQPLWSGRERLTLLQHIDGNSGTFAAAESASGELEGLTLDELLIDGERVGLIKIDTEGSEGLILKAGRQVLERDHPFVCVEAHNGTAFRDIAEILGPLRYELLDIEGRSSNYIWAHPDSSEAGGVASLRQLSVMAGNRRLRQQVDRRIDGLSRRLERSDEGLDAAQAALLQTSERLTADLAQTSDRLIGDVNGVLHEVKSDVLTDFSSMVAERLSREVSGLVTNGLATQHEIRKLLTKLAAQGDAMTSLGKERAQLQAALNQAMDRIRWLETEKRLWQDSYAVVARSRGVRFGAALRRLMGRRRDLVAPEARAEWVRRQTKRQAGPAGKAPKINPPQIKASTPPAAPPAPSTPPRLMVRPAVQLERSGLHELRPAVPANRDLIRVGIASIPERVEGLKHVVGKLYSQVDELFVYLNRFEEAPEFLRGDSRIRIFTGDDLGDRGKFRFIDDFEGYFIAADDDIDYPTFYVDHLIDGIERYGRRAAVGWHGSIIKDGFQDYYSDESRRVFSYRFGRPKDVPVHILGTGCAAFHTDTLALSYRDFPQPNMADVYFALKAQEQSVPLVVLAHQKGWAPPLDLTDNRSISTESMAKTGHGAFDVRAETNRLVTKSIPWKLNTVQPATVREPLSVAVVGRTDRARWKKGGILKSTNLTADMLRPLGVDVRLFDLETGDPWDLGGFRPQVVMIYPGDPARPDFHQCEKIAEHHADLGSAVLINLSVIGLDWREKFIVERMTEWRQKYGQRIKALVFAEQVQDFPAFAEIRDLMLAVPKTIDVPHPPYAAFHETEGIFLGDIAKLVNDELLGSAPVERWIEAIRSAVPEAPLYAVRQYRPNDNRDLGVNVLPFLTGDFSEKLSRMRLMVNPIRHLTFEMVPVEVAAMGVPVIYQRMEHSLSAYLGMSAVQVDSPDDLADVLPALYRDPTLWRPQSRAGQLRAQSLDYRLMASQMYLRLAALARHATIPARPS
ncbi:FkbM family methyltransferase [Jiangella aurantiaca]|uniref:FkbM family methyltransferase n=1 Tax=Jiangella aurantiaca TaxID=2530373 RepID=A0A4R5AMT2_9ACTN|nr:FkbM family methyltransferase [Jiangella aurantiaca]TDD73010.1 FkbM family methyltransferase [Jiangella aurantiaca]